MSEHTARPVLAQHDIEQAIVDLSEALETLVDEYGVIAHEAAVAEADLKEQQAIKTLQIIERPPRHPDGTPVKMTVGERDAHVETAIHEQRRAAAIAAARRETAREAMNSYRTRIEAYRTLAANVRYLTTGS